MSHSISTFHMKKPGDMFITRSLLLCHFVVEKLLVALSLLLAGCIWVKRRSQHSACGVNEYLTDEETGLLVPPNDSQSILNAISRLKSNPDLTRSLGENAKKFAQTYCDEAATVSFFENFLDNWL